MSDEVAHHKLSPNYFPEQLRTELKHVSDTFLLRTESECRSGSTKASSTPSSLATSEGELE